MKRNNPKRYQAMRCAVREKVARNNDWDTVLRRLFERETAHKYTYTEASAA